jgi:tetratricopeptide (TPR) repeat protein
MTDYNDEPRPAGATGPEPAGAAAPGVKPARARGRTWLLRLTAMILVPVVVLAVVELLLRVAGFGYRATFLLPATQGSKQVYIQNCRFGWRFFGEQLSRVPWPLFIPQTEVTNTVRVFVFGESAAYGDPLPAFGLPRMIEAMLSLRHPGVRFEVENAAMTAINSHAVLPIARDCAEVGGDVWVIYMGNNEVVGPFGAGTVFGPRVPPLPLIRASLWLKTTRTGELLDSMREWMQTPGANNPWTGMSMFVHQRVSADDARMKRVYGHFARNLEDILAAGQRGRVGIVLSTVAVNLKDCPPFASEHRPGLSPSDQSRWEELYALGCRAQDAGSNAEAAGAFQAAAKIDDRYAELRFRQGRCALALGRASEAREDCRAARDLDALRFRCDSRLNDLIRQAAAAHAGDRLRLADAERVFSEQSPDGLPGEELFYEHVHLKFKGNYLLARTIVEQMEPLLPPRVAGTKPAPWPSPADCARRLGWSEYTRADALRQVYSRITQPPFPGQMGHEAHVRDLRAALERMAPALGPGGMHQALRVCEQALKEAPDDPMLYAQLGFLRANTGDFAGAAECARRHAELLPSDPTAWGQLGMVFLRQHQLDKAATALGRAFDLHPNDARVLLNRANVLAMMGRANDALNAYRRVVRLQPSFSLGWIMLGNFYATTGHRQQAEQAFGKVLANNRDVTQAATVAMFCRNRGWFAAAATNYANALELDPLDVTLRVAAGENLALLGRHAEAGGQFRDALRLAPGLVAARLDLGQALMDQGSNSAALAQFEMVLRQSPTNATALERVQFLRGQSAR